MVKRKIRVGVRDHLFTANYECEWGKDRNNIIRKERKRVRVNVLK